MDTWKFKLIFKHSSDACGIQDVAWIIFEFVALIRISCDLKAKGKGIQNGTSPRGLVLWIIVMEWMQVLFGPPRRQTV